MKTILAFFLFFIVTYPAYKNLILPELIDGHDVEGHLIRLIEFDKALIDGNFPVRWGARLNYGLGYPFFTFDYPMAYHITNFIHILGLNYIDALKFIFGISFPLSGFFAYIWLKNHFSKLSAFIGAIFFTLVPYHFVNVYVRGALAEIIGVTLVPLNLYLIDKVIHSPSYLNAFFLSLGLFVSITSHNITALIYCLIWFSYALVRSGLRGEKFKNIMLGFVGSVFLSAFFVIPALYYSFVSKITQVDSILTTMYARAFPSLKSLIYSPWGYNGSKTGIDKGEMAFQMGVIHEVLVVITIGLIIILLSKKMLEKKTLIIYFTLLLCLAFFLMQEVSISIWKIIVPMQFMEFPWRLLSVMALTSSFLIAFFINWLPNFKKIERHRIFIILVIVSALFYADRNIMRADKHYTWVDPIEFGGLPGPSDLVGEHLPKWHNKLEETLPYFAYNVLGSPAKVRAISRKTNLHLFQVTLDQKAIFVDRTDYFPGWRVFVNDREIDLIDPYDTRIRGLIGFELPPGEYKIESKLKEEPIERIANGITIVSFLFFLFLVFYKPIAKS